jgi:hypothetical protein
MYFIYVYQLMCLFTIASTTVFTLSVSFSFSWLPYNFSSFLTCVSSFFFICSLPFSLSLQVETKIIISAVYGIVMQK